MIAMLKWKCNAYRGQRFKLTDSGGKLLYKTQFARCISQYFKIMFELQIKEKIALNDCEM